jgi:sec-independent protein translocase protein TatB
MFDIGWSELLLIGVVALIAIGPKELPGALRTLGQWMGKVRRMAAEFQGQFQEAMREAEIDQLKKDMDEMAAKAKDYTHFDPLEDVRRDVEKSMGDLPSLDQPSTTNSSAASETPDSATTPAVEAKPAAEALPPPAEQTATTTPATPEPAVADATSADSKPADTKPEPGRAPA